jgi:DNA-binding CsgD family transcriptional regulator
MRQALVQLAGLAAEGEPVRAAWLYGAAGLLEGFQGKPVAAPVPGGEALHRTDLAPPGLEMPVAAPVRERDARDREAVRARLGAARFAAAHDLGAATPLDEAVSYALAPDQPLPAALAALETEVAPRPSEGTGGHPAATDARPPDGLSVREIEVLRLMAAGRTNREIADVLVISVNTVFRHVTHILQKTGASNRAEATAYAHRNGLAD